MKVLLDVCTPRQVCQARQGQLVPRLSGEEACVGPAVLQIVLHPLFIGIEMFNG